MKFLVPSALGFLLTIPVIVLFYLLKQKKVRQPVSSSMLWQKVLADSLSQTPWQRLRRNLLMLLQILAVILLALALTRPYLEQFRAGGQDLVLMLDTSASMSVVEEGKSRLELARAEAENLVREQERGTRISLIEVGEAPRVLVNQSQSQQEVLKALRSIQANLAEANLETALALVTGILEKGSNANVVFFSDGGVSLPYEPVALASFSYRRIGSREDNLAIGAFAMREAGEGPVALLRVDNYGSKEASTAVRLSEGDKLVDVQAVKVPGGKSSYLFWNVPAGSNYLSAHLETEDGLALDNDAWLVPGGAGNVRALLVTKGNVFLEQALKLNSRYDVHRIDAKQYSEITDSYDLYVFDGFLPPKLPNGPMLAVNPPVSDALGVSGEGTVTDTLRGDKEHPVLRNVSWEDVHIAKSKGTGKSGGWQGLVMSGERALISVTDHGGPRRAVLGFDLHQTDLPLRPAFPIFIQNTLNWLVPKGSFRAAQIVAGTTTKLNLPNGTQNPELYPPGGTRIALKQGEGTINAVNPGIYRLEQTSNGTRLKEYLAANFVSDRESRIKPEAQIKLGMQDVKAETGIKVREEFWSWLALAALILLCLEWWVYLRGH